MKAYLTVALVAFGSSAIFASLPACFDPGGDCECQPTPAQPSPQSLPLVEAASYDSMGNFAEAPIDPVGGTIEVTGTRVLIGYEEDGASYEVVYELSR